MKSDEKLWEVCKNIFQEMYEKADPPMDFKKELKAGRLKRPDWFLEHELSKEEQEAIMEKHNKKNKLSKVETRRMRWTIFDYSPKFMEKCKN